MSFGIATVAAIVVICYVIGGFCKSSERIPDEMIPWIVAVFGGVIGVIAFFTGMPDFPATDVITAIAVGMASGLAATGVNQIVKQNGYRKNVFDNLSNNGGEEDE